MNGRKVERVALATALVVGLIGCTRFGYLDHDAASGDVRAPNRAIDRAAGERRWIDAPVAAADVVADQRRRDTRADSPGQVDNTLCNLDERAATGWSGGCVADKQPCTPTVSPSTAFVKSGTKSAELRCLICGFDSWVKISPLGLYWDLSAQSALRFWVRSTLDHPPYLWQDGPTGKTPWVIFRDVAGAKLRVEYVGGTTFFNGSINTWLFVQVPFSPGPGAPWTRTIDPGFDLQRVVSVELHVDCWDYGFTLWLDGVGFTPACP